MDVNPGSSSDRRFVACRGLWHRGLVMLLTPEALDLVRQQWVMGPGEVLALHRTVPTRLVAHVATRDGEFALKVDAQPHVSVMGGELVQAHVSGLAPSLAAAPLPTRAGTLSLTVGGSRYTVTEWVRGRAPDDAATTWSQVGAALARLHGLPLAERQFAVPIRGLCEDLTTQPLWPTKLVSEVVRRARSIAGGELAVVHGQPTPANMIQRSDGGITLLDWDESGTGLPALDLGYPLICLFLTSGAHFHADRARAFYRGYRDQAMAPLPEAGDIFAAALLHGLRSAMFAEPEARLRRVQYALDQEDRLRRTFGTDGG